MFAITGITGQVGGATARALMKQGQSVRAIVRDASKARAWVDAGAEITIADFTDSSSLEAAFTGVEGVFAMIPANFAPSPGFPEPRAIIDAMRTALKATRPGNVVALSSVGAQKVTGLGLITQLALLEEAFCDLPSPVAFVRPAWFLENSLWDMPSAKGEGKISSFLDPLDRAFPMIATADIGIVAAELLQQKWTGKRVVELEGPRKYSQIDIASAFASLLKHPVEPVAIPRDEWVGFFEAQGTPPYATAPRVEMLNGFNSGWIDFEGKSTEHRFGKVTIEEVLAAALVPHG